MSDWVRELDCVADEDAPALPVYAVRPGGLAALFEAMPAPSAGFLRAASFTANAGAVMLLPGPEGLDSAVLGLGDIAGPEPFAALPFNLPQGTICRLAGAIDSADDASLAFCLGAYRFEKFKASPGRAPARLVLPPGPAGRRIAEMAETIWLVRDLINLPANHLGPAELAAAAADVLGDIGARIELVQGDAMAREFPLIAAVGAGSARPPLVVRASWQASGAANDAPLISICGKGVCFDTGGYDIKPASGMLRMKKDMSGAAVALGLARMIALSGLKLRLQVRLGCVENSISGNAMRPSDIVRSRRGLSVAVANTDAEGRLVLADLLAEASDEAPDLLLDFATLTGAARIALGPDLPALFCNDDRIAAQLEFAGRAAHDPVWRLPLHAPYDAMLDGHAGDLDNVSEKPYAGAILAALFLQRFVAPGVTWAHYDLYGWNDSARLARPEGGEAQCLRGAYGMILRLVSAGDSRLSAR